MSKCKTIDCKFDSEGHNGYCDDCHYWNERMAGRRKIGQREEQDQTEDEGDDDD